MKGRNSHCNQQNYPISPPPNPPSPTPPKTIPLRERERASEGERPTVEPGRERAGRVCSYIFHNMTWASAGGEDRFYQPHSVLPSSVFFSFLCFLFFSQLFFSFFLAFLLFSYLLLFFPFCSSCFFPPSSLSLT